MSSLFGALETSVSGLSAQSAAFGNISDNVANSQTTGFKRTDTEFVDYLSTSNQVTNDSGFVAARPNYRNGTEGSISTSDNPLAVAISGQGFFQVTQESNAAGATSLSTQTEYSRAGNFSLSKDGYLVNGSSQVLNGWSVDTAGVVNKNQITPIKINQSSFSPVATTSVNLSANLPSTPPSSAPVASQVNVYDATGTLHQVSLAWTRSATDTWTVAVNVPDAATPAVGGAQIKFGSVASGNPVPASTIGSIGADTGTVTSTTYSANGPATLNFTADFGEGPQTIKLNLGSFGGSSGVTQFAGTSYTLRGLSQDGIPPGAFSSVTTESSGDVIVNYDNGQSRVVAQVPIVEFAAPDKLQRRDGQAFTTTTGSGDPLAQESGVGGAGAIVTNSLEGSNVDIASEFTKLIVAQRAYSANTKLITTADELLQQTIDMKR